MSKGWGRVAFYSVLLLFVASVVGLVAMPEDGEPTPQEELAEVQRFLDGAGTVRFTAESRSESGPPEGEAGSRFTDVYREDGVIQFPDRSHYVEDAGEWVTEYIELPHGGYSREADTKAELDEEQWVYWPREEQDESGDLEAYVADDEVITADLALGAMGGPTDLFKSLDHLNGLTRPRPGVVQGTVALREFVTALGFPAEALEGEDVEGVATVEITSSDDGRLDRLVMAVTYDMDGEDWSDRYDVRFSAWNQPVAVEAPTAGNVDPTPNVDEAGIAEFDDFPLYGPTQLPAGFELLDAVVTNEDDEDFESEYMCPGLSLSYGDPDEEPDFSSLDDDSEPVFPATVEVTVDAADCSIDDEEFGGWMSGGPGPHEAVTEVRVLGPTRVTVAWDGDDPSVLTRAVASLAPLDLAAQPVHRDAPPPG